MSTEDTMTIDERYKYLRRMQKRYKKANRQERQALLDEMETVTELHRKSLIRLMRGPIKRRLRKKQRGRAYGIEVDDALRVIAESTDYLCAERLRPNLAWLAEHLGAHGELKVTPTLLTQLAEISVSTVQRRLAYIRQDEPRLPRKGPIEANRIRREIPMRRIPWNEQEPGHFEVDLVHHGGEVVSGQYVHTLQMVDVFSGWSERVAVLGRSYLVMADGFRRIESRLPLPIVEIHPDNGAEFLNDHLVRYWRTHYKGVTLSRSRPYQKNDNRFVEQKNQTLVRAYLGSARLDTVAQTALLNQLYDQMWLYYNFFQPVMRLQGKTYTSTGVTRVRRKFDKAQTPYDRLCAVQAVPEACRRQLDALRQQTNPRQLRRDIYQTIDAIFALPCSLPRQTQDVYLTLNLPSSILPETILAGCGHVDS